ncbi:MAG: beta-ketoacyl-[acyl-carrier-protein] synthase family protein, partial [Myxococcales bacterium]|nr:beta-ketoacyl-[acyl-carrier-protein] synthase family protein [Myxococcales bacterium]
MNPSPHRVVVTGMGVVTPLGNEVDAFLDALLAGRSGVRKIRRFDVQAMPTRIAAEAELEGELPFGDRKIAFALSASRSAIADATRSAPLPPAPCGIAMGVGLELFSMADLVQARHHGVPLPSRLEARLSFMQTPSDMCVHLIASEQELSLPPRVHVSACAAGTDAIGDAFRQIASGRARRMLAGGTDSMINPLGLAGFCALKATSTRNEEPERASRPFDRRRDGFVMGEGAAVLMLERLEDARARGAPMHAEILGYGSSFDAYKVSDPHPEGRGALLAMRRAIADASLESEAIDAVNAHGTGTQKNDPAESLALERLLGERAPRVPISATKSMIGHLISAAGAVEAVAAIGCMRRGKVHPTINLEEPDPACRLDYVPGVCRSHPQEIVLSSSFGFGGHNAA